MENSRKNASIQLLVLITTPKLAEKAADMFRRGAVPIQYRFNAEGTATSEIMDLLGLGSIDKCVLVSMLPKTFSDVMLEKLRVELKLNTTNSGIAFTIPITGANNLMLRMLTKTTEQNIVESNGKDEDMMTKSKHVLIATIVNRGFSGDVMEAARSEGAKGGTVMHSRRIGNEEVTGFWGLSVQEEKEVVLILVEAENKVKLMSSISEKCGMHSDAKGVVMSLPIDSVIGV